MKRFFYVIATFSGVALAFFATEKEAEAQTANRYYPGDHAYDCPQSGTSCVRLKTVNAPQQ